MDSQDNVENYQQENEQEIKAEIRKCACCQFFKSLKKLDVIILVSLLLVIIFAGISVFGLHKFGKTPVQKEQQVAIQVFFRNLIISNNVVPFKVSEKAFITIRNVPYTSLEILAVNGSEKKTYAPARNRKGYAIVTDVTQPLQYDFLITLKDTVKVTNDGEYVVGGNKLKVGLPIILEGNNYRFNGVISSIQDFDKEQNVEDEFGAEVK